jgi:hypothetical protein
MKWILIGSLFLLAACGGGGENGGGTRLCDRYDGLKLGEKVGTCDVVLRGLPTKSACESSMASCTADDRNQLDSLLGCLGAVQVCQSGQEESWVDQFNSCFNRLDLSSACGNALNG